MNKRQQKKRFSTCIQGMNITKKTGGFVTDCPFIEIRKSTQDEDICAVIITGSERINSLSVVKSFHIGILEFTSSHQPFYSSVIPEHSLAGIYLSLKNKVYRDDADECMIPQQYEEKYLELVVSEFGEWLYQNKKISRKERNA